MERLEILEKYSNYLLENAKEPATVYHFAKDIGLSEEEIYRHFSGFKQMNAEIIKKIWDNSLNLAMSIDGYAVMGAKEQLLNFYYILFENLKMNRSLVLLILEKGNGLPPYLNAQVRNKFNEFVNMLNFTEQPHSDKLPKAAREMQIKARQEIMWKHLVSVLMFWRGDHSANFENTDLYIEKSVDTGFEVAEYSPAGKIADLAKFIWKEKFHKI